jgi:hypothetical protein
MRPSKAYSKTQRRTKPSAEAERMRIAVRVEAMRRARTEVKAAIQREGRIKLSAVPAREITAMAEAYVLAQSRADRRGKGQS